MKCLQNYQLLWAFALLVIFNSGFATSDEEDDYDEEMSRRYFNRQEDGRPCRHRRQEGVCKKRSECRRPTRRVCHFGANPVVCCLDKEEATSKATTVTTKRPSRTTKPTPPPVKPENNKNIDLTFPGCGLRSPNLPQDNRRSTAKPTRGGLLSRLGKRDIPSSLRHRRTKRFLGGPARPVIVGGVEAKANSWPWMVALFKQTVPSNNKTIKFLCGASLISRQYVITAAHCFDNERTVDPTKFFIAVGSHNTKDGLEYSIQDIRPHPEYKKPQYYGDLCLLKLTKKVELSKKVYPVCLPSDGLVDMIRPGANDVIVTGWGDTSFGGVSSQVLHEVTIPIVPLKKCNESYMAVAKSNFPQGLTNHFICAGEREGGKDSCQGDSGGPMVARLKNSAYVQLGVVSFGYFCARPGFPGVYTRLSQYTKWLYENTDLG